MEEAANVYCIDYIIQQYILIALSHFTHNTQHLGTMIFEDDLCCTCACTCAEYYYELKRKYGGLHLQSGFK